MIIDFNKIDILNWEGIANQIYAEKYIIKSDLDVELVHEVFDKSTHEEE